MVVHTLPMGPPRVVIPISHHVAVWKWGGGGWGGGGGVRAYFLVHQLGRVGVVEETLDNAGDATEQYHKIGILSELLLKIADFKTFKYFALYQIPQCSRGELGWGSISESLPTLMLIHIPTCTVLATG